MYSLKSLSALSALFALANAASSTEPTSTVSIPFPAVNPTDLGLSVVTVAPSSTVYKVGCALKANGEPKNTDCHWIDGLNPWLTLAPTSLGFNITANEDTMTFKCKVSSTSLAECVTIDESGTHTHKETNKGVTMTYSAATITAGLEKLQAAATPASTPGSTGSTSSAGSTGSTGSSTTTSTSAGSAGAAGTTSTSSGGAGARETGLGLLAMAGVVGAGLVL